DCILIFHEALSESAAAKRGQGRVRYPVKVRKSDPGPIIGSRGFPTPHPAFAGIAQRRQIHVNRALILKATGGPKPFIAIGRILKPREGAWPFAGEGSWILKVVGALKHACVSGLEQAGHGARFGIKVVQMAVTEEPE